MPFYLGILKTAKLDSGTQTCKEELDNFFIVMRSEIMFLDFSELPIYFLIAIYIQEHPTVPLSVEKKKSMFYSLYLKYCLQNFTIVGCLNNNSIKWCFLPAVRFW